MLGQAGIDQDHRDASLRGLYHHVGPEFGFDKQREIRLPMIEKTADEAGNIERDELVNHAAAEPLFGKTARGDGACCDQHANAARPDPVDQRQDACKFADACAVQPHERTFWPRKTALTPSLGQALSVFLAALKTARKQNRGERSRRRGQQPINPQTSRQFAAQGLLLPVLSAISYARIVIRLSSFSTRRLNASWASRSASPGTKIASPATTPTRPNGKLMAVRSQLSSSIRRLDAIASG